MPQPRFHCAAPLCAGSEIDLPEFAAHHARAVLRLTPGERVTLFCGDGLEYPATLSEVGKRAVRARLETGIAAEREAPVAVTLAQGISAAEKMDFTIQKAVELGVARVQPLATGRAKVRLDDARAEKRLRHWQQVAISACEQCGRNRLPEILAPRALTHWLAEPPDSALRLTLAPGAGRRLADLPAPEQGVILLVGPEGGLDPGELAAAEHAGFTGVRLGPRILRTETAALAALAAMNALWGDF